MQKINPLCPTIHRTHRKIGRNENCPCGRMRDTQAIDLDHLKNAVFTKKPISNDPDEPCFGITARLPMKYKHCCGDITHKKIVARANRNIANTIRSILGFRKHRRSLLKRIMGLVFRKK